jgi:hypothetical protein
MPRLGLSSGEFRKLVDSSAGEILGMSLYVRGTRRATIASSHVQQFSGPFRSVATILGGDRTNPVRDRQGDRLRLRGHSARPAASSAGLWATSRSQNRQQHLVTEEAVKFEVEHRYQPSSHETAIR